MILLCQNSTKALAAKIAIQPRDQSDERETALRSILNANQRRETALKMLAAVQTSTGFHTTAWFCIVAARRLLYARLAQ